ncbi:AAA family ATPase [Candidatus Woesearchaeota archaeon]|nr:AAA family ATPase [Candidatus Woesearchaeota archaeon]
MIKEKDTGFYIANQDQAGFDEIQRLLISYTNHNPVVLEGEPGVGKTELVKFLGKLLETEVNRFNCSEDTMLEDIIGGEKLTAVGEEGSRATDTKFVEGVIPKSMKKGEICYLDEFNQVRVGVQKGLNSTLEEDATLRTPDQKEVKVNPGYLCIISYNPGTSPGMADIEPAVADRCKYIKFEDLNHDLQVRIALVKAKILNEKDILDEEVEERGVIIKDMSQEKDKSKKELEEEFSFVIKKDGTWCYHSNGKKVPDNTEGIIKKYLFYNNEGNKKLDTPNEKVEELYELTSEFINYIGEIKEIIRNGTNYLSDDFKEHFDLDEYNRFDLELPGPRPIIRAIKEYQVYKNKGYSASKIKEVITRGLIDGICKGKIASKQIGKNCTLRQLFEKIAQAKGLLNKGSDYADIPISD